MAQIQIGSFGYQAPNRQRSGGASQSATSAALQNLSGTLANVAGDIQNTQEAEQRKAEAEARQRLEEQKRADEALQRAKVGNLALDHELNVKTIAEDIVGKVSTNEIPYVDAQAEYEKQVSALQMPDISMADPVTQENFDKAVKRTNFATLGIIKTAQRGAMVADYKTQTDTMMDTLGKQAGLPGANVEQLNAKIDSLDTLGSQAYGKEWSKVKQTWRDNNWNSQVSQQVLFARDSMKSLNTLEKELTTGSYTDKLDSDRRNTQLARIEGYKSVLMQKQEVAANKAEREQEHRLHVAEAEYNTFQGLADKGTTLDPSYVDRAIKATAGTPYQAGVKALFQQAQENGGIARQPLNVQQATLDAIDKEIAKKGRTPELDKRREQVAKVVNGSISDLKENGLRAGVERGVIDHIAPLDISSPQGFASSISERLTQSQIVGQWAGKTVSPLDTHEAEAMKGMLDALPPKQRSQAVGTIAAAVGPQASTAIAQQLDQKDRALGLAFATSTSQTTQGRNVSELILKGASAIKDGSVMKDDKKVTGWKATISGQIDGMFGNENTAQAVKDSAYLIAAGIAQENGGMVDGDDIDRAVRLAVGGNITERNGKKIPLPAGVDDAALDKRLKAVPVDEINKQSPGGKVRVGGVEIPVADFVKSLPGQELAPAGYGKYHVMVRGRPVTNAQGKPIVIGVQ